MGNDYLDEIKNCLNELKDDSSTPRNVRKKAADILAVLENKGDISINVSKALNILEELADDINIEAYTRTQIWNISSMLEKIVA